MLKQSGVLQTSVPSYSSRHGQPEVHRSCEPQVTYECNPAYIWKSGWVHFNRKRHRHVSMRMDRNTYVQL